jgi:undecaprenyl-diphosphatase
MNNLILFGAKYLYLVIALVALVYLFRQPQELRYKIVLCALLALPLTYVVAKIASLLYYDPRPFVVGHFVPLLPHDADNGFPSDHTLLGSALAAVIYFFNRRIGIILLVIALGVGIARVLAGIHHMVDILGSIGIAFGVTYVVYQYIFPKVWKIFSEKFLKTF